MDKKLAALSLEITNPPLTDSAEGFSVQLKDKITPDNLRRGLVDLAYENMNLSPVEKPGQFSIRGGIVDIWLERYQSPARIDFFGDRVESVYLFDPLTHKSLRNVKALNILRFKFTSNAHIKWPKRSIDKFERLLLSDIKPGDLVVHIDHGIGRFLRVEERNLEGRARFYLIVEYAKGEKLYVPVQQIDRISKYIGVGGKRPALNFLGTQAWEKTKKQVKGDLIKVARELLKLYAVRESKRRPAYPADSSWQVELEESFPYELTPSQKRALTEIKSDLEAEKPMDRLLVGDVGFGKTELALRSSFKVVQAGSQVVVMVPTSILAEQHFYTFCERMEAFAVKIALLSRFQSAAEQKQIIARVGSGEIDILIGTHRILGRDVSFKNLGLLVIDEEHRFGVMAKDQLKKIRSELDVLAMSATPIPRSLYLSLTSLRDISLLSEPPTGRLSIKNYIGPFDQSKASQALLEEKKRGGQSYFLHNRVRSIGGEVKKLQRVLPDLSIEAVHAQMESRNLERVMKSFMNGQIDVLVCSSIIGSGLDIANANTIIIKDAHKFGLADLYQLRGRVGRSSDQAYAWFFYPKGYLPKGASRDRLEAIGESEELGAGFNLAEKDLEIRGAGNLLGVDQHGTVSVVGFELYLRLLTEAVDTQRVAG